MWNARAILSSVVCPDVIHFLTFSHKRHDFRKQLLNIKCVFWYSLQILSKKSSCLHRASMIIKQVIIQLMHNIQGDSVARGPKRYTPRDSSRQRRHSGKSIPKFGETHSSVLGCERRPVSASILSRFCFASFPVCVYKFSSLYLKNIIFIDSSLGPLATESLKNCFHF